MHSPSLSHEQTVKHILCHVEGTVNVGVRILSQSSLNLYGFFDADWAGVQIHSAQNIQLLVLWCIIF